MSMQSIHDLHDALFGMDSRFQTGEKLKEYGAMRVLLLHDEAMKPLGHADELEEIIRKAGIEVCMYQMAPGEPDSDNVQLVVEFALKHKIDGIVGLGGGACMDTAKLVGKTIANGGRVVDYLGGYTAIGSGSKRFNPIVLLSTTSGTGSEVSYGLMTKNVETGKKIFAVHPGTLAILDPYYTIKLPKSVTAFTGIDAFCHSAECLCNSVAMPNWMADIMSIKSIELVMKYLPIAYDDGENLEARSAMSYAAMLGGYAITLRKTTFGHAIANQLSDKYHFPHGIGVSCGIAAVARYNVTGDPASTKLWAPAMGIACPENADLEQVGRQVVEKLDAMQKHIGLKNMKELGVEESFLDVIVDNVAADKKWAIVPNPPKFELVREVLKKSYDY